MNKMWKKENKKYLPWIIGSATSFFLFIQVLKLTLEESFQFEKSEIIFIISSFIIPLATVNTIYLSKVLYKKYYPERNNFLFPRIAGLLIGVVVSTVFFEYIYWLNGILDDDNIVLGAYELSPRTSEVIDNTLLAVLIGVPIFLKKQIQEVALSTISKKEEELNRAYQLKIQSELEALQSKVNPHFLYNSLNSIACLIHEDPAKAERMVLLLSDLFRYTLNYKNGNYSTIEEELKMVRAYLEIELIRFEDNLTCEIDVKEELTSLLIPRFLLQPLVENAIKHGTSKRERGQIKLQIFNIASDLCISVADNGPAFPEEHVSGYGLKGTLDKLNLLYKGGFEFSLNNEPMKEVRIILKNTLPDE